MSSQIITQSPPLLVCENLGVSYTKARRQLPAVRNFDLKLYANESVGLVGESGCGKSTVALAIVRTLGRNGAITNGRILFRDEDVAQFSRQQLRVFRRNDVSVVYQEPTLSLNPSLRIGRQLSEALFTEKCTKAETELRCRALLAAVDIPDPQRVLRSFPHQLSGGQQQRVVIAMALLGEPKILLLDEPTTALDVTVEAGIVDLIFELKKKFSMGLLFISHNLGLIAEICDRVMVMYAGEVVEEGPVAQIFHAPEHPYTRTLLAAIPRPGMHKNLNPLNTIRGQPPRLERPPQGCLFHPRCRFAQADLCTHNPIMLKEGTATQANTTASLPHRVRCARAGQLPDLSRTQTQNLVAAKQGEVIFAADNLSKRFGLSRGWLRPRQILHANTDVSLDIHRGQIVALVGESGCGKSTFAKVAAGLHKASEGNISFRGEDIAQNLARNRSDKQLRSIQMIFQNPAEALNPKVRVGKQLVRAVRRLSGVSKNRDVWMKVHELLTAVKLPLEATRCWPRQLSGGQKQRVAIARALAGAPEVVLADEPVSALDVSVQAAVIKLLTEVQAKNNVALLFISHDLSLVRYLADWVAVMYLGEIVEAGPAQEVFTPPFHPYTEALLSAVPIPDPDARRKRILLKGALPSPTNIPKGCPFHTRCPREIENLCAEKKPPLQNVTQQHHLRCHIPFQELAEDLLKAHVTEA